MAEIPRGLSQRDWIVARATAPGAAAIAIIRVDGAGVARLVDRLFHPRAGGAVSARPRRATLGRWIDPPTGEVIDEGLTLFFPGPHSYTGNDLAEFHTHGGAAVTRALIAAAVALGARPAEPGEFTRRAYLNGRMDLAQAEAIADLIEAETGAAARNAQAQLAGGLSEEINRIRALMIDLGAEIEARIDFPDEDIEPADQSRLDAAFDSISQSLEILIASRARGRLLREGAAVALFGPPNVGKSSLMNALARADRAIVTPHAGTTRDTLECVIDLKGAAVTLIDTAGLRATDDPVERIGVERARRALAEADLALEIRDASGEIAPIEPALTGGRAPDLVILNKADRIAESPSAISGDRSCVLVSALTGKGIEALETAIYEKLDGGPAGEGAVARLAVNERQAALLASARDAMAQGSRVWLAGEGSELVMIDLREALARLDELVGAGPNEAILDRVFAKFCLGK